MQQCGDNASVALLNLLDPEIFPYTMVNGSVFPAADDAIKGRTPVPGSPGYDQAIIQFVMDVAPDTFQGQPVQFQQTFNTTGGLEIWGAPISSPAYDPSNNSFIYQRFQRGIMHYAAGQGTRGILLADYLKSILLGPDQARQKGANLPPDLDAQAKGSAKYAQYCPGPNGLAVQTSGSARQRPDVCVRSRLVKPEPVSSCMFSRLLFQAHWRF
jgi:hypothetical protein